MVRRVAEPFKVLTLLAVLGGLPLLVVLITKEDAARDSVWHVVVSFAVLMLAFRLLGKRELSRLSPFELVTLMLIPEILSNSVQGQGSMLTGLAGLGAILFLVLASSVLSQRFEAVQKVMEAPPTLLVADGRLLEANMNRERIAPDELQSEMRKQGLASLREVRFAVLEGGGNITFVPVSPRASAPHPEEADVRP
jgi:uncharacterized membrane protein YcaP (DUF421 family)